MKKREKGLEDFKASLLLRWTPLIGLVPSEAATEYCIKHYDRNLLEIFGCSRTIHNLNNGLGGASV